MSGHNKWSQIKLKKGKADAAKSRAFSKFARLITEEARRAKGDRNAPNLRAAIERAKRENMPNENIERAVKRATEKGAAMESVTYEAYGPGGAALIVEALTDNRNRAAQEIKRILLENLGTLAGPGAALWAFAKSGAGARMEGVSGARQTGRWRAATTVPLSDEDLGKLEKLVDALEGHEDVQEVATNAT